MFASLFALATVVLTEAQQISADTIMSILEAITSTMSVTQIVAMIAGIIGVGMTFVFLWWGVRKGFRAIMGAVTRGKLKV